jgi:hypothetical protein
MSFTIYETWSSGEVVSSSPENKCTALVILSYIGYNPFCFVAKQLFINEVQALCVEVTKNLMFFDGRLTSQYFFFSSDRIKQ